MRSLRSIKQRRVKDYERYKHRRTDWIERNGPCVRCGSSDRLEIDHINREEKLYGADRLWGLSPTNPKVVSELAKCQVLCRSCHIEKSIEEGSFSLGRGNGKVAVHGTESMYSNQKCRCKECRVGHNEYMRDYRKRKKRKI